MRGSKKTKKELTEELKALKDSEEIYRTLVENISLGMALIDTNYRIIMTNIGHSYILKKPQSEFIGKYCFKEFEKRDAVCSHCPGTRAMATGRPAETETEGVRDDGSRVPVRIHAFPVYKADGTIKGFIEVVEDISEHKQTEEALKESQETYKTLFEGAAEGILVADIKTMRFKYANQAICRMLGYTEEELTRLSVPDIHPKGHLQHVISEFEAQVRGEKSLAEAIPCRRKDGTVIYADINSAKVLIDGVQCNVGLFTDITERKQTEEALKESQERYKTLLENIPQKIFLKDTNSVYISCNDGYAADLKIAPEEIKGKTDYDFYPKQLADKYRADDREVINSGETKEIEEKYLQGGQERIVHTTKTPVRDAQGHVTGVLGIFWDITKRKRAEQELERARDELEIRVKERTADLEEAVEKLRNEVSERKKAEEKLLTYQKQLRSSASELSLAEERLRRKIATDVHDNISQNLAISKLKIESLAQSVTSPELAKTLKEIRDLIAQTVESTRSLTFELSPPILYELGFGPAIQWLLRQVRQQHGLSTEFTDDERPKPLDDDIRVLLFQAVRELLVNIVKHAKASSVKISTQKIDNQIRVSVEDDGIGFDVARVHSHDRMTSGFGLFNIRERLDHIGGHLDITSRAGKGTRITLLAPITHQKEKTKRKQK